MEMRSEMNPVSALALCECQSLLSQEASMDTRGAQAL